jgi:hypothetical protein
MKTALRVVLTQTSQAVGELWMVLMQAFTGPETTAVFTRGVIDNAPITAPLLG